MDAIERITPQHGGQLHAIAASFGLPISKLLDFSANINPDGPPLAVVAALKESLGKPKSLTQYPDLEERTLKAALARYAGCIERGVLVANGFVPLLDASLRSLNVRSCLVPVPAFNEYRRVLERNDIDITTTVLDPEQSFHYDVDALLAARHDAVLLANPQNPSGVLAEYATMVDLVTKAAARNMYVLLDEAFIDYASGASLSATVSQFENLIVFRSVTKCFGIPGLRLAYAITHERLRCRIEAYLPPWPISTLASIGTIAAVQDEAFIAEFPSSNERRRVALARSLQALGLKVYPAAANFLLFRLPEGTDTHQFWRQLVIRHGIVLRLCLNFEGMLPGHLRAGIQSEVDNEALTTAISSQLRLAPGATADPVPDCRSDRL